MTPWKKGSCPQEHPNWPVIRTINEILCVKPVKYWGLFVTTATLKNTSFYSRPTSVRQQSSSNGLLNLLRLQIHIQPRLVSFLMVSAALSFIFPSSNLISTHLPPRCELMLLAGPKPQAGDLKV